MWRYKRGIVTNEHLSDEYLEKIKKDYSDYEYCKSWDQSRRWLTENQVDFSQFKEEFKFQELVLAHNYLEKAKKIQHIIASYSV